ncbi:MAG: tRNA (adenosine(37)-N6)-dimethylallyltransferase MiaA [Pseudomonadota bacterium]
MNPAVLVLTGPTASGKTEAAIRLARELDLELVNADSLQIFRRLDIGTAKPTKEELGGIPYHLIDVLNPDEPVTAAWYAQEASKAIRSILARGKVPVLVGGSGFYLRAVEHPPIAGPAPEADMNPAEMYQRLLEKDPDAARRIHPNDRYRLTRASAILSQGLRPSDLWKDAADKAPSFNFHWVGLHRPKSELNARIDRRMADMFANGLVVESQTVLEAHPLCKPRLRRAIGYKEALNVLEEGWSVNRAIEQAQTATRHYAKRQMTWFRKEPRVEWVPPSEVSDKAREIVGKILGSPK